MIPRSGLLRRHPRALVAVAVASAALLALGLFLAHVQAGGPLPPALRFLAPEDDRTAVRSQEETVGLSSAEVSRSVVAEGVGESARDGDPGTTRPGGSGGQASTSSRPSGYEHLWQAETVLGGERGTAAKHVREARVTLTLDGDTVSGDVIYGDLLGTLDPSGVHSQSGSLRLELVGKRTGTGTIGGTFDGTAILLVRGAESIQAAVDPTIDARSDGVQSVYAVSGHWGGRVTGGKVAGEILFERAELTRSSVELAPRMGADFFNRLGPTPPGEPQTFTAVLGGDALGAGGEG